MLVESDKNYVENKPESCLFGPLFAIFQYNRLGFAFCDFISSKDIEESGVFGRRVRTLLTRF